MCFRMGPRGLLGGWRVLAVRSVCGRPSFVFGLRRTQKGGGGTSCFAERMGNVLPSRVTYACLAHTRAGKRVPRWRGSVGGRRLRISGDYEGGGRGRRVFRDVLGWGCAAAGG